MRLGVVLELIGRSESGKIDPTFADSIVSLAIQLFAKTLATALVGKKKLRDHEKLAYR